MKPLKGEGPLDWAMRIDAEAELADKKLIKPLEFKLMKLCQGLKDKRLYEKITEMETQGWEKAKALIRKHTAATSLKTDLEQKTGSSGHVVNSISGAHRCLARVGYATKPLLCAWITTNINLKSISTGFVKQKVKV